MVSYHFNTVLASSSDGVPGPQKYVKQWPSRLFFQVFGRCFAQLWVQAECTWTPKYVNKIVVQDLFKALGYYFTYCWGPGRARLPSGGGQTIYHIPYIIYFILYTKCHMVYG